MKVSLFIILFFAFMLLAFHGEAQEQAPQGPPMALQERPQALPPSYVTEEELTESLKETKRDWKRDLEKTEEHMEHILEATTIILMVFGLILLVGVIILTLFLLMTGGGLYYIYTQSRRLSRQRKELKGALKQIKERLRSLEELTQRAFIPLEKREVSLQLPPEG